jgi:acylaminoacyl-peptidase
LRTRFPGDDFDDLMRGMDFLLPRGSVDPQRLAISGGLVAAWALGHTDRFHAVVARRPIADWAAEAATGADGMRRATQSMGAMPWEDAEQYTKHSPLYFASAFRSPTLVIAGEGDPGSEELYFALQSREVDSALIRIPAGAGVMELEAELAWLARP